MVSYYEKKIKDAREDNKISVEKKEGLIRGYKKQRNIHRERVTYYEGLNPSNWKELNKAYIENHNKKREDLLSRIKALEVRKESMQSESDSTQKSFEAARNIAFADDFIAEIEALGDLTEWKKDILDEEGNVLKEQNNTMYYVWFLIFFLFIFIEISPILAKILSGEGLYDSASNDYKQKVRIELRHEANGEIRYTQQTVDVQAQILADFKDGQIDTLKKLLDAWEKQYLAETQQKQLTSIEYKQRLEEILNYRFKLR